MSQVVFPTESPPEEPFMATEFKCLHCDATVSMREIQDGWCDSCGKKVPDSIQCETRKAKAVPAVDNYDEPKPRSGRRLLVSSVVIGTLLVILVAAVMKLA